MPRTPSVYSYQEYCVKHVAVWGKCDTSFPELCESSRTLKEPTEFLAEVATMVRDPKTTFSMSTSRKVLASDKWGTKYHRLDSGCVKEEYWKWMWPEWKEITEDQAIAYKIKPCKKCIT